eukprot:GHVN01081620.1.p1 GENE.GHVN01081620.1~~GHVN01081620.1.p1  ORF type:complete len:136 (-),score=2.93 GHVN01081620.1:18-425(-)
MIRQQPGFLGRLPLRVEARKVLKMERRKGENESQLPFHGTVMHISMFMCMYLRFVWTLIFFVSLVFHFFVSLSTLNCDQYIYKYIYKNIFMYMFTKESETSNEVRSHETRFKGIIMGNDADTCPSHHKTYLVEES